MAPISAKMTPKDAPKHHLKTRSKKTPKKTPQKKPVLAREREARFKEESLLNMVSPTV